MNLQPAIEIATALAWSLACWPCAFAEEHQARSAPPGMVLVPAGQYTPLFRGEREPKQISAPPFFLDVFPVTNGDFFEFVRASPKWRRSHVRHLFADEDYLKLWAGELEIGANVAANAPVAYVSWFAAKAYCQWRGKRLPTIAEWEYTAAASATRPDGENDPEFTRQVRAWYSTPAAKTLARVGQGQANYFGIHNLNGWVWEWVADLNAGMVTGDARGDTGLDRQLFCGSGSVGVKDRGNFPAFMRYGFRSSLQGSYTVHNLSFRCAKNLNEEEK